MSDAAYNYIFDHVPRLCVDVIIRDIQAPDHVLLSLRDIEPFKGSWHIPGGRVHKGELVGEATIRIARAETGLEVMFKKLLDFSEYTNEIRNGHVGHSVSLVVEADIIGGSLKKDHQATELRYWNTVPPIVLPAHHSVLFKFMG